ncbi:uncharacterized protein LOC131334340 [Rhododendron vialii]|uniref:uncharacterized protein LOC131334340 n=1 Tax=Rhododendron vialii TaxID=182163 RepID=UPI00265E864F|nr:uncharacterized protein LOC131334340 [Rhododendron vialii]
MNSKGKPTRVSSGEKEEREQSGKDISKGILAQRARRERERIFKQTTERRSEQHSPINTSIQPLRDGNIRADGRDQHVVHVPEDAQRIGAMAKKRKATYVGSGKENSEDAQRIGAMAKKRKATYVGSGKENSEPQVGKEISKLALAQRARRERERNLKQSTAQRSEQHLLWDTRTQPLHEINIGATRDEHYANIGNNLHIREVEPLRDINVGVEIHEERNVNIIRVREVPNGNIISKKAMAQRARRERERNLKHGYSYQSGQRSQVERTNECLQPIPHANSPLTPSRRPLNCFGQGSIVTQPIEKQQRVAQTNTSLSFMPNTTSTQHTNRPTLTDQMELCYEDELEESVNLEGLSRSHVIPGRHNLGNMDIKCTHCKALHWMDERLTKSSTSHPLFGTCCFQGKIRLPTLITPPPPIRALYDGDDDRSISFRKHSREYNATNAFTSLGATLDPRMLSGRGPTSFTIHGELRHRVGSLLPQQGKDASYAQLYIYDPASALEVRNRRNQQLRKDVLQTIQETLLQVNPFVDKFRQAYAILDQLDITEQTLPAHLHYNSSKDRRRYNLPTSDEIAVVIPGDGSKASGMRDIVLHLRGDNQLMQINECHPAYLPLHYVLLFPRGELGWEPEMKQWDVKNNRPASVRLTQMEYYSHHLFERRTEYSTILRGGKLFQEFLVDSWAATEQNRLTYYKLNQARLRTSLYHDLTDIGPDGLEPDQIGQRMILPSSFTGGPRHMFEIFQDSMAITRYNHHPDIFLTMTANPKWPEITSALLPHQTAVDRLDLVARVFELKRKALMKEIEKNKVFGQKVAHVYTIEFQKRGLPHMHVLFFLLGRDKIRTCAQVDKLVCAEFPNLEDDPELFETVKSCMVHGPCGARNPHATCMENGKCTKRYSRAFAETTTMDENGYPIYRRRDDGKVYIVRGHEVDNRDVVPYNPHLSKMFNCHINVEVCAGMRCVKYIHKYIYKGHDRATTVLGSVNEIKQ